ncbi:MAG: hypothetical protein SPM09_02175 [Fibrobacter sp.]|jgi:hypothetical protein|uniref:hypothetical protein n=1 Tax=Fibrobacter sp. TaxID=35828 RepID=UPI002A911DFC|nr:hypothetical protein [Fibrobacter sp.]MDY6263193.1 hypothetical protein [Fibrobacter sp.]
MKAGDRYDKWYGPTGLNTELKRLNNGKGFSGVPSFIPHLIRTPEYSCAKLNFYAEKFPDDTQKWWNEFDGVTKSDLMINSEDLQWFLEKTNVVHEIYSPLRVPQKPGGVEEKNFKYHPENIIQEGFTKRLIFGKLPGCKHPYVFLGVYEIDKGVSLAFSNANGYSVDAASFPRNSIVATMRTNSSFSQKDIAAIQSDLITYPHSVWKRISNVWGE